MTPLRRTILGLAAAIVLLIGAINAVVVIVFGLDLGRVFSVPNAGMAPTIKRGDCVYMDALAFARKRPARGDVVCFRGEDLPTLVHRFDWQVKRIVGLPGDTLSLHDGQLFVNERPAPELAAFRYEIFMFDNFLTNEVPTYTVPKGSYFVLGDNPLGSYDSRFFGPVPAHDIAGDAVFRWWPPSRVGLVK
jgi:signal peptidase I